VILVFVALFGTTVVSMVSTQNVTAVTETQSTQALYVAEGGSEFGQRALAQNLNWYRSTTDPIVTPATALGAGNFTVNAFLPATVLRRRVTVVAMSIPVFTAERFPATGYIQLHDDIGSGEFVQYSAVTAVPPHSFTVAAGGRDVTIGGVSGAIGTYPRGTRVYPVFILRTLLNPLALGCGPTPSAAFDIDTHSKLLPMGTLDVEGEEISYKGTTPSATPGRTTLTGVVRCVNGQTTTGSHGSGYPMTPLLNDGVAPDFEAFPVSTGTVGAGPLGTAVRVVQKTVQR
jgi:hypothetical protein